MKKNKLEDLFSTDRLRKFYLAYQDDNSKAIAHYKCNIIISEAFYPGLSVLEVALRNSINKQLTRFFGTTEWYSHFFTTPGLASLLPAINTTYHKKDNDHPFDFLGAIYLFQSHKI